MKEDVYQPDWLAPERLTYSDQAAEILAALLPDGMVGSVSTVPGTFKAVAAARPDAPRAMADAMARHAANLVALQRRTGREIVLALEPEPCCFLETIEETVAFFQDHLHADASAAIVAQAAGLSLARGARRAAPPSRRLLRHLPRRGGVRGSGRRVRALRRGRHPHRQAAALLRAAAAAGRRRDRADALGVRRRRLPAPGGGAAQRHDHAPRRPRAGLRGAARRQGRRRMARALPRSGVPRGGREIPFDPADPEGGARLRQGRLRRRRISRSRPIRGTCCRPELRRESRADAIAREMRWVLQELADGGRDGFAA